MSANEENEKDAQVLEGLDFWVKQGMMFVYINVALSLFFIALYVLEVLTAHEVPWPPKLLYLLPCAMSATFAALFYYNYKKAKAEIAKYQKVPDT